MRRRILIIVMLLTTRAIAQPIVPNLIVSLNKTVFTSSGSSDILNDNLFRNDSWEVSDNSWIAIPIGGELTSVFVNWNDPSYSWSDELAAATSCKNSIQTLEDYTIQTSNNSTNGDDGDWLTVHTVTGNSVTSRGHAADINGALWVKLNITKGGGNIDEFQIFDISNGSEDIWFFTGTSISANTYKGTPPSDRNFSDLITKGHAKHDPIMIKGGIPCISSGSMASDVADYLAMAEGVKYWAIEMGTNDAWGGSSGNASSFKTNLQTIIDACRQAGVEPIIARVLSTNEEAAEWQVHQAFLDAVDDLVTENDLIEGPDLYAWFLEYPGGLDTDGVHPNSSGAAHIQRLWAEKMAPLYGEADSTERTNEVITRVASSTQPGLKAHIYPNPGLDFLFINAKMDHDYIVTDLSGKVIDSGKSESQKISISELKKGVYVLKFDNQAMRFVKK